MKKQNRNRKSRSLVVCDHCTHSRPVTDVVGYGGKYINCTCDRRPKPEWQMYGWPHDCNGYEDKE